MQVIQLSDKIKTILKIQAIKPMYYDLLTDTSPPSPYTGMWRPIVHVASLSLVTMVIEFSHLEFITR